MHLQVFDMKFEELTWAILFIIVLFLISIYILYKMRQGTYRSINIQETEKTEYPLEIFLYVTLSLIIVMFILIGNYIYTPNNDGEIFKALSSGEVIVGISIASPAIYTWLMTYRSDKKEEQKKEQERIKEELFNDIKDVKKEYIDWLEKFSQKKEITLSDRVVLSTILEKADKIKVSLENKDESKEKDNIIDYLNLFVVIQKELGKKDFKDRVYEGSEWRKLITRVILQIINQKTKSTLENINNSEDMTKFFGIDFSIEEINNIFLDIDSKSNLEIEFICCKIKVEDLSRNLFSLSSAKTFKECVWIGEPQNTNKDFSENQYDENYVKIWMEDISEEPLDIEVYDNTLTSERTATSSNKIFENRDLASHGPINEWVYGESAIDGIELSTNKNLKNSILENLKQRISIDIGNFSPDNVLFSKSKNWIDTMKGEPIWEWHSWNAITEKAIDNNKYDYVVFAVNIGENEYSCIVFTRDNFFEMLKNKKKTSDNRYFFYFGKLKNESE